MRCLRQASSRRWTWPELTVVRKAAAPPGSVSAVSAQVSTTPRWRSICRTIARCSGMTSRRRRAMAAVDSVISDVAADLLPDAQQQVVRLAHPLRFRLRGGCISRFPVHFRHGSEFLDLPIHTLASPPRPNTVRPAPTRSRSRPRTAATREATRTPRRRPYTAPGGNARATSQQTPSARSRSAVRP